MHHISQNWERVFDFQFKVVIGHGQCDIHSNTVLQLCSAVVALHSHFAFQHFVVKLSLENALDI